MTGLNEILTTECSLFHFKNRSCRSQKTSDYLVKDKWLHNSFDWQAQNALEEVLSDKISWVHKRTSLFRWNLGVYQSHLHLLGNWQNWVNILINSANRESFPHTQAKCHPMHWCMKLLLIHMLCRGFLVCEHWRDMDLNLNRKTKWFLCQNTFNCWDMTLHTANKYGLGSLSLLSNT